MYTYICIQFTKNKELLSRSEDVYFGVQNLQRTQFRISIKLFTSLTHLSHATVFNPDLRQVNLELDQLG